MKPLSEIRKEVEKIAQRIVKCGKSPIELAVCVNDLTYLIRSDREETLEELRKVLVSDKLVEMYGNALTQTIDYLISKQKEKLK